MNNNSPPRIYIKFMKSSHEETAIKILKEQITEVSKSHLDDSTIWKTRERINEGE